MTLAPLALLLALQSGAQPVVWTTHATVKIRPSDQPGSGAAATLEAARNEFEAFQVAINGGASGVGGVSALAPALVGPQGATIPAANVRLYREALITTQYASTSDVTTGAWPDALVPDVDETAGEKRNAFPFDVPAGENRVLWVEVLVPQGAAAGQYTGTLALSGAGGFTASVPVSLTVWPFTLPSTASLGSTFGQDWDALCQAYYGGYSSSQCQDAGIVRTHSQLAAFMLDHRLTVDLVYTGPSGGDWTSWDASYGPYFDGTAPTRLVGAKQTTIRYVWNGNQSSYASWAQHFRTKGWFDRTYDYTCDEPPATCAWSDINTRAATIHGADPQFRTLVTTTVQQAAAQGVLSSIDILAPVINEMDDKSGTFAGDQRPQYDSFLAGANKALFWYQSCMSEGCSGSGAKSYSSSELGWATMMIDAPAIRNRAMEWLSFMFATEAELYWDTTYDFSGDPWTSQWSFGGNGDGNLLYPGTPAKIGGSTPVPVASIRLKMIREGMEDYEYLKMVSDLGDPAFAQAQAATIVSNPFTIEADPTKIYAAREALAQRIAQLSQTACPDGTDNGACSTTRPMRCSAGALVADCTDCGCASGLACLVDGSCGQLAGPDAGAPAGLDASAPVVEPADAAAALPPDAAAANPCDAAAAGPDAAQAEQRPDASSPGSDAAALAAAGPDAAAVASGADAASSPCDSGSTPVVPNEGVGASCQTVPGSPLAVLGFALLLALRRRRSER